MGFLIIGGILLIAIPCLILFGYSKPVFKAKRVDDQSEIDNLRSELAELQGYYRLLASKFCKAMVKRQQADRIKRIGPKYVHRDKRLKAWVVDWTIRDCDMAAADISTAMVKEYFGI